MNGAQGVLAGANYIATQANAEAVGGSAISNDPVLDTRDSDALLIGTVSTIYYKTGNAGVSNHGLDIGFTRAPQGEVTITNKAPPQVTVGDRLWFDTNNDGLDNDGVGSGLGSSTGISNAVVELYQDTNGDGVFTPGVDKLISTTTSSASGYYSFTGIVETNSPTTTYMVVMTSSNFAPGGVLANYRSSDGNGTSAPDVDANTNPNDDNGDEIGTAGSPGFVVATKPFTLTAGGEPTGEGNSIGSTYSDADTNATPSLGFYRLQVGNSVWNDLNNNGLQDSGEPGLANVPVAILDTAGNVVSTTLTNASGLYTFTGLVSGTYVISITPTSGYTSSVGQDVTANTDNNDNGAPSGAFVTSQPFNVSPNTGTSSGATGTTTNGAMDFGLWQPAAIASQVWEDLNHDGQQDPGEPGIAGVLVSLQTPTGTLTTTTDASGNYTFTNLISGTHAVTFTAPSGYTGTLPNVGSDLTDSDGNPITGATAPFTVNAGQTVTDVDGGLWRPASLGDRVWEDLDHDGQQDPGEPGVAGVVVSLQTPTGTLTTTTDSSGNYTFTNLISGTHAVTFTAPSGYTGTLANVGSDATDSDGNPITGATAPFTVNAGQTVTDVDGGLWQPATIASQVWEDLDHDGVQDPGEPGVAGVVVSLQTPTGTITTTTDSSGNYTFTNLISGTHAVTFTAPSGYTGTLANVGSDLTDSDGNPITGATAPFTVNAGQTVTDVDGGLWRPATIASQVWEDLNHDGQQDPGEPGVAGVVVSLQTPTGTITTTTDSSGNYTFTNLISSTYAVTFTAPSGYTGTLANVGSDGTDSDGNPITGATAPFTVNAGQTVTDVDGGLWRPAQLGNRVWEDYDHDGVQDAGEPGIPGVLVSLQTPTGTITMTTDASGNYTFTNLISGTHVATFTAPSGYTGTLANVGSDLSDSDANAVTGVTGPINVTPGATLTNVDVGYVDAGFWRPATIASQVWEDLDHDGVQDAGEPGVAGVLVSLQTPTGTITTLTDSSGNYTFTNLISGTYAVTFTAPSGYTGTLANVGNDLTDSDGNPITGATAPFTVNAGQTVTDVDGGLWRPATIASQVWEDLDHDGQQDPGEPGVAGVVVSLQTPTGTITTTTDSSGNYTFTNLISSTYAVTFTAPSGYTGTLANVGSDATDSDGNPITGATAPFTVNAGQTVTDVDGGLWRPAQLGNRVWEDYDHDGVQDAGEPGIPGVLVTLQTPTGTITTTTECERQLHVYELDQRDACGDVYGAQRLHRHAGKCRQRPERQRCQPTDGCDRADCRDTRRDTDQSRHGLCGCGLLATGQPGRPGVGRLGSRRGARRR